MFQKITGKVLIKYEHNVLELKEKWLKERMWEVEKRGMGEMEKYLKENLKTKKDVRNEEVEIKGIKIWKDSKFHSRND